jgi:hypothetical protein
MLKKIPVPCITMVSRPDSPRMVAGCIPHPNWVFNQLKIEKQVIANRPTAIPVMMPHLTDGFIVNLFTVAKMYENQLEIKKYRVEKGWI